MKKLLIIALLIVGCDLLQVEDCLGNLGGNAVMDNCGTCDFDTSNDCVIDCDYKWGGTAELDICGVCNGNNMPSTGTCDCAGVPNGYAALDECGVCETDTTNLCVQDCHGLWGGDAFEQAFYHDYDQDGLGGVYATSYCVDTLSFSYYDYVADSSDTDDYCISNVHDCVGICDGTSSCQTVTFTDDGAFCTGTQVTFVFSWEDITVNQPKIHLNINATNTGTTEIRNASFYFNASNGLDIETGINGSGWYGQIIPIGGTWQNFNSYQNNLIIYTEFHERYLSIASPILSLEFDPSSSSLECE